MAYITITDLEKRYSKERLLEVAPDSSDPTQYDIDKINTAIEDACNTIDAYIFTRYKTPLQDPPEVVKNWACGIAFYNLFKEGYEVPEAVDNEYTRILEMLRAVGQGGLSLPIYQTETDKELYLSTTLGQNKSVDTVKEYY